MTRRQMLQAAGSAYAFTARTTAAESNGKQLHNMGGAPAGFPMRSRAARETGKPFDFVEHCHNLGLGVVETRVASTDPQAIKQFRQRMETYNMRAISDIPLPRDEGGVAAFDSAVKANKEAGIVSLHAAMTH